MSFTIDFRKFEICIMLAACNTMSVDSVFYRFGVPPATSNLKPGEMSSQRRRAQDCIGILLDLLVRDSFVNGNGVVGCADGEERYADRHDRVGGGGITVICVFGGITPSLALNCTVELVQVGDILNTLVVQIRVLQDGVLVHGYKLLHVGCKLG